MLRKWKQEKGVLNKPEWNEINNQTECRNATDCASAPSQIRSPTIGADQPGTPIHEYGTCNEV